MVLVFVMLLVTGCCCKQALKSVQSHMSMKLKDEFTALLEMYKQHDNDSSKHVRVQGSAVSRQEQLERRTQRARMRLDLEALDKGEARMEMARRRNQEDYNRQHGGYSDRGGVPHRGDVYGDYQVVPAEHQGMVHQPPGGRGRGRTSARYGVEISHLSEEGQCVYSAVH